MNSRVVALFRCLVASVLVFGLARAQNSNDPNKCHFRAITCTAPIDDLFLAQQPPPQPDPQNPGQSIPDPSYTEAEIHVPIVCRSGFIPYDKSKELYFVRHVGKLYQTVAVVDLTSSPNLPLLFFVPLGAGKFQVNVYMDDPASFPSGSFRLFDASDTPVSGTFNKDAITIKPGESKVITPQGENGKILMALYSGSDTTPFAGVKWAAKQDLRCMIFIFKNAQGQLDFNLIKDSATNAADPDAPKQ